MFSSDSIMMSRLSSTNLMGSSKQKGLPILQLHKYTKQQHSIAPLSVSRVPSLIQQHKKTKMPIRITILVLTLCGVSNSSSCKRSVVGVLESSAQANA